MNGVSRNNLSRSTEYRTWKSMIRRCTNPTDNGYKRYGGRGIKVCKRWIDSFDLFLLDMGNKPTKNHSIERIDNDGNYEPSNCCWATRLQQMNNRSVTLFLEFNGEKLTQSQWAKKLGIARCSLSNRFRRGWTIEKALTKRAG